MLKSLLRGKNEFSLQIENDEDIKLTSNRAKLKKVEAGLYTFSLKLKGKEKLKKRSRSRKTFTPFLSLIIKMEYPITKTPPAKITTLTAGINFKCKVPTLKLPDVIKECKGVNTDSCSQALKKENGGYTLNLENVSQLDMFVLKLDFASNVSNLEINSNTSIGVKKVLSLQLCGWSYYFLVILGNIKPLRLFLPAAELPDVKYMYYGDYFCNSVCGTKTTC